MENITLALQSLEKKLESSPVEKLPNQLNPT